LSTAHSDDDVDRVVQAVKASIERLRDGGFLPQKTPRVNPAAVNSGVAGTVIPLTEAQRDLWVVSQLGDDVSRAYNESIVLHLHGSLATAAFQSAWRDVFARHEALKAVILGDGRGQVLRPDMEIHVPYVDLSTSDKREIAFTEVLRKEGQQVFD